MKKLKNWNWSLFFLIICLSFLGALGNPNLPSIYDSLIVGSIIGIPFGLLWAYMDKKY